MKKLMIILIMTMLIVLTGCTSKTIQTETLDNEVKESSTYENIVPQDNLEIETCKDDCGNGYCEDKLYCENTSCACQEDKYSCPEDCANKEIRETVN